MASRDRDLRVGWFTLVFGLYVCWASFTMPSRGGISESPGIFPGLMGLLLVLFAGILITRSMMNGGRIHAAQWGRSVMPFLTSPDHRPVILGIALPALYLFAGIPLLGFYPSSGLFMTVMFYLFVKQWRRRLLFLPVAIGITGLLYFIFNVLFMLQIR
jgi:hypothetical protein